MKHDLMTTTRSVEARQYLRIGHAEITDRTAERLQVFSARIIDAYMNGDDDDAKLFIAANMQVDLAEYKQSRDDLKEASDLLDTAEFNFHFVSEHARGELAALALTQAIFVPVRKSILRHRTPNLHLLEKCLTHQLTDAHSAGRKGSATELVTMLCMLDQHAGIHEQPTQVIPWKPTLRFDINRREPFHYARSRSEYKARDLEQRHFAAWEEIPALRTPIQVKTSFLDEDETAYDPSIALITGESHLQYEHGDETFIVNALTTRPDSRNREQQKRIQLAQANIADECANARSRSRSTAPTTL